MTPLRPRPHPLAVLRVGTAVLLLVALSGLSGWMLDAWPGLWKPVGAARLVGGPPSLLAFGLLWWVAAASAVLLAVGKWTRAAGPVAVGCTTLVLSLHNSLGKLDHGNVVLLLAGGVLVASGWHQVGSLDARGRSRGGDPVPAEADHVRPMRALLLVLGLTYLASAGVKLWRGDFLEPGYMQGFLASVNASRDQVGFGAPAWARPLLDLLLSSRLLSDLMGYAAFLVEALAIVAAFGRRPRILVAGSMLLFHSGIALLSGIQFRMNALVWLLVLVATWAERRRPAAPLPPAPPAPPPGVVLPPLAATAAVVLVGVLAARLVPGSADLGAAAASGALAMLFLLLRTPGFWPAMVLAGVASLAWGLRPAGRKAQPLGPPPVEPVA